ncbi:hypothetical protein NE237_030778 [Protea cynaroides]|uniref:Uncharacterized protein n=1 Tax=Protea cynaroides TaxID=273540 RepID=A0A9Q0GTN3_9MAGN|nr:hypothetical protein NE237_030778 [Protea cynaroides]
MIKLLGRDDRSSSRFLHFYDVAVGSMYKPSQRHYCLFERRLQFCPEVSDSVFSIAEERNGIFQVESFSVPRGAVYVADPHIDSSLANPTSSNDYCSLPHGIKLGDTLYPSSFVMVRALESCFAGLDNRNMKNARELPYLDGMVEHVVQFEMALTMLEVKL